MEDDKMRSKNTDLMSEIKKFAEEYYLEYWKSPSTSEIAGAVGVTRATVYRYLIDMAERGADLHLRAGRAARHHH